MSVYILPVFILAAFLICLIKRKRPYEAFVEGVKKAFPLVLSLFPYLTAVFIMTELFEKSGLNIAIIDLSAGFFSLFGIPREVIPLVLLKPFSGSGSLGILSDILKNCGVDSYLGRLASVIYGSSETIFYVGAVYYSACKNKPPLLPFLISIASNFTAIVFACLICRLV